MKLRPVLLFFCLLATIAISLDSFIPIKTASPDDGGKLLFERHCSTCHELPNPADLTKLIWQNHVLPVMAARMGIIYPGYDPLRGLSAEEKAIVNKAHIIPTEPELDNASWAKLVNYVINQAPDSIALDKNRLRRDLPLGQFVREDVQIDRQSPSLITSLKYNPESKHLWIGNFYNQIYEWDYKKGVVKRALTASPAVDFNFYKGKTYLTEIGKLYPTELSTGSYAELKDTTDVQLLSALHRPVAAQIVDLDNDGTPEIVVCNFGNKTGSLSLFKKNKAGKYTEDVLLPLAGAIKCFVQDMDGDGKKDIIAMFSQGDESVYIFYQKDNLKFRAKRVLRFPPDYGTTDLVLTDYNHDGQTDLVTVHGDNADYSDILKPYHGIRIHINQGNAVFKQEYFYPLYGVTQVLAEDFDQDGDIDFAATAFFPDFGPLLNESFVYLENTDQKQYQFKTYVQHSGLPIKTLALAKADIDGDGDIDIITGNFAQSPGPVPKALDEKWKSAKYGLSIFLNQLHQPAK